MIKYFINLQIKKSQQHFQQLNNFYVHQIINTKSFKFGINWSPQLYIIYITEFEEATDD